ncbi:TonB-dependent receptor [Ramlibacter sp. RBP-2]|uniref:TonB-dependent receptor n=1 Tax=Ramlibacter lithotrophicus TaxID=2606681 RepID=A0A7X6DH78_9BURK|nr:TonB-dependent receptor [Ramlibacter lithotrophicus]
MQYAGPEQQQQHWRRNLKTGRQQFRQTVIVRALIAATCGSASMMIAHQAMAQQSGQSLQRVEITGSNIRRAEAETASPVQTVTREDLEKSGKATVAEYLQTLSVDNQGSVPTTFGSGFASGASGISLRGLGAASTLVLINGRRIAPYGLADDGQKVFGDLNVIPLEAVDRVEILKDGGSSIYGSDAMAGVVNVILRKNYRGTVAKATFGQSRYGDGTDRRVALTHGFGDPDTQGFNVILNLEMADRDAIYNRDRKGRGTVGRSDLRPEGFDAETSGGANGGTGAIIGERGAAVSSVVGNVRNPTNLEYFSRSNTGAGTGFTRTFPGANCDVMSRGYPQGDPGGGCLTDAANDYTQIQPDNKTVNFFARASKMLNANNEVYGEFNYYKSDSRSQTTPSGVHSSTGYPGGPVSNAAVALGASHPDNPYFGTAARLRYLATDVGARVNNVESEFTRLVAGAKGTMGAWDYDTAFLFSQNKVNNVRNGFLQRDVTFALLNPTAANVAAATARSPAYAALPAGSVWRIAENAGLNSSALYAALSPDISNDATSRTTQIDFKVNRELGKLEGGPIGVAFGAEIRRESMELTPTTGTERGNIIGLGYSAYEGARTVTAAYGEALFPVTKRLELNAALRADHYSDAGNSVTPKFGAKFRAMDNLALRGTYAHAFRAPSAAENGRGGLAFFSSASDPTRCAMGIQIACNAGSVAGITSPNPALEPEKARSLTLGAVWDLTSKTSLAVDLWEIRRKNEINQESTQSAVAAGRVSRDPSTALPAFPGDPGAITAVLINYVNSNESTVRGVDFDLRHRIDLAGQGGRLNFGALWTHLFKWQRTEKDGTTYEWAGTIGNHDVTNATGTPKDRINLSVGWDVGRWKLGAVANYRGSLINKFAKDDADCASHYANGNDAPGGCRIASFTTVDLSVRYKLRDKTEIFGGVANVFDRIPPLDPITYGAVSYNPLDYRGAVGRFYSVGVRHQF